MHAKEGTAHEVTIPHLYLSAFAVKNLGAEVHNFFSRPNSMGSVRHVVRTGCQEFHVGDVHVWTEIYYLDSPTDYREYIHRDAKPHDDHSMILLDDCPPCSLWTSVYLLFSWLRQQTQGCTRRLHHCASEICRILM